jgi:hypothetical protein
MIIDDCSLRSDGIKDGSLDSGGIDEGLLDSDDTEDGITDLHSGCWRLAVGLIVIGLGSRNQN